MTSRWCVAAVLLASGLLVVPTAAAAVVDPGTPNHQRSELAGEDRSREPVASPHSEPEARTDHVSVEDTSRTGVDVHPEPATYLPCNPGDVSASADGLRADTDSRRVVDCATPEGHSEDSGAVECPRSDADICPHAPALPVSGWYHVENDNITGLTVIGGIGVLGVGMVPALDDVGWPGSPGVSFPGVPVVGATVIAERDDPDDAATTDVGDASAGAWVWKDSPDNSVVCAGAGTAQSLQAEPNDEVNSAITWLTTSPAWDGDRTYTVDDCDEPPGSGGGLA